MVVGIATDAYEIATSDDPLRKTFEAVFGWIGAVGGGVLGATGGAALTAGNPLGATAGGVAGAIAGGAAGRWAGGWLYDQIFGR